MTVPYDFGAPDTVTREDIVRLRARLMRAIDGRWPVISMFEIETRDKMWIGAAMHRPTGVVEEILGRADRLHLLLNEAWAYKRPPDLPEPTSIPEALPVSAPHLRSLGRGGLVLRRGQRAVFMVRYRQGRRAWEVRELASGIAIDRPTWSEARRLLRSRLF